MEDKLKEALDENELAAVSGGLKVQILGRRKVTTCDDFVCVWCGHRKAQPLEAQHTCNPQGNAIFDNVCNECEHLYTCGKANSYVGLGSPVPPTE